MKKYIVTTLVAASLLALAGCASTGKHGGAKVVNGADGDGAYSSGAGSSSSFDGENGGIGAARIMPGQNQTYHFQFNSSTVEQGDIPAIKAQAHYLATHSSAHILLAGNTDSRGSREYNIGLGERRAKSVEDLMMVEGAKQSQIRLISYGSEKPVALGNTEEDYQRNRRVDLTFESK